MSFNPRYNGIISNFADPFNLGQAGGYQQQPQIYLHTSVITGESIQNTTPPIHPSLVKIKTPFERGDVVVLDDKKIEQDYTHGVFTSGLLFERLMRNAKYKLLYYGNEIIDPVFQLECAQINNGYIPIMYMIKAPKNVNEAIDMMKDFLVNKGDKV